MVELAASQAGFLGIETTRGGDGFGITVLNWTSVNAIANWKNNAEHLDAQKIGKRLWYEQYELRVAKVERSYSKFAE